MILSTADSKETKYFLDYTFGGLLFVRYTMRSVKTCILILTMRSEMNTAIAYLNRKLWGFLIYQLKRQACVISVHKA